MAVVLATVSIAAAQNVAANAVLLTRIKEHMREEFARVPNYTCLETTDRFYALPPRQRKIRQLDAVRLEIVFSDRQEWYAAPRDRSFTATNPVQFITRGMIGNGAFGVLVNNILLAKGAIFFYRGEENIEGRRAVRYDYHWTRILGGFEIDMSEGKGSVGERGSFWADPRSLDLIRISSHAVEIPTDLPVQARRMTVSYARTRIRDYDVLLAQEGDMYLLKNSGEEDVNHVEFSHCRAYSAQSVLRFDSDDSGAKPAAEDSPQGAGGMRPMEMLPESVRIELQLTTPITEKSVVGASISAKVVSDVMNNGTMLIRRDSIVRGRIRQIERHDTGFWVSLEFTEIDGEGPPFRFYADLKSIQGASGVRPKLTREFVLEAGRDTVTEEKITMPELPGVASFFVRGVRFSVPSGTRMTWTTRSL